MCRVRVIAVRNSLRWKIPFCCSPELTVMVAGCNSSIRAGRWIVRGCGVTRQRYRCKSAFPAAELQTSRRARSAAHREPATAQTPPIVRIQLLGAMRATSYLGTTSCRADARRAQFSVASVSRRASACARSRLAAMLWDRVPEFQARASFRQALSRTRRRVRSARGRTDLRRSRDASRSTPPSAGSMRSRCWRPSSPQNAHRSELAALLQRRTAGGTRRHQRCRSITGC